VIRTRRLWLVVGYVALVTAGILAGPWLAGLVDFDMRPSKEPELHRLVLTATAVYIVAAALPFVPGAEVGLALLMVLGAGIAPLVYLSMVVALSLAFLTGRLVPARTTAAGLDALGLQRARALMLQLDSLDTDARLQLLSISMPRRFVPFLLDHRYLMLALAFNLPGNTLLGGGGGIAMAAGLSGLYSTTGFLLTVVIAVAPVPLLFVLKAALT
jgi:hypothetical protein